LQDEGGFHMVLRDEGVEHGAQVLAGADTQGQGLHDFLHG
jgi:hypothetical protein